MNIGLQITKNKAREKMGFSKQTKYLLFFGQIKMVKRLDVLIDALKYLKSPTFTFILRARLQINLKC